MNADGTMIIHCEDIRFAYESEAEPVLRGVNIDIERGEFVVIAGPSGAGKSTFCRTLNNIVPLFYRGPFSGKRRVLDEWLEDQKISSVSRNVGMVFQDFEQQLFSTSGALDLAFALENFCEPREQMARRLEELSERLGLGPLIGREPSSLSGGEKQKLAIASVMAYKPTILVLDEPTTDLDPESRRFVLQVLPRLKDWVDTVIIVDQETELFQAADRVFLFKDGAFSASGAPAEILKAPTLLSDNSLNTPELIQVQSALGHSPTLATPEELAGSLVAGSGVLVPIPVPARTAAPPVIEAENLCFRYPGMKTDALTGISMEVRQGEFLAVLGRNGSGKSTLVRHFNGLQQPQKGNLLVMGREVRKWNRTQLARTVGLVFQNPDHQIFESTVRAEVEFGPTQFGFSPEAVAASCAGAIRTMDLGAVVDRDPFQLSKGERQRVAVASVLSAEPDILILDEPTTGLDHRQQKFMMELLRDLNRAGKTIVVVTHSLALVAHYCSHMVLLEQGRVAAQGHPRQVFFEHAGLVLLPPLLELSKRMGGNALTIDEFVGQLRSGR